MTTLENARLGDDSTLSGTELTIQGPETPAILSVAKAAKAVVQSDDATIRIANNATLADMVEQDTARPLDYLVATQGKDIPQHQLIKIGNKIMAVAFMADAQTLIYDEAVLTDAECAVPTTVEGLIETATMLRDKGIADHPIAAFKGDLSLHFLNFFYGAGGTCFDPDSTEPTLNTDAGIKALETLKSLAAFTSPDTETTPLRIDWASTATQMTGKNTKAAAPLTFEGKTAPATTLWWTGWTLSKDASAEKAETAFLAMKRATSRRLLNQKTMPQAVWLMHGFKAQPAHHGTLSAVAAGAAPYPMSEDHNRLMGELDKAIPSYLEGDLDTAEVLETVELAFKDAQLPKKAAPNPA